MDKIIKGTRSIQGQITVPGDKSISHRALILGALAHGRTVVENLSPGRDVISTVQCLRGLGVSITACNIKSNKFTIEGHGLCSLRPPTGPLDAGNSGTTLRLLTGVLAAQRFPSLITGDSSLRRRPMGRIIEPLRKMGAEIVAEADNFAPLAIQGRVLQGISYEMRVKSAQVKSCVLLAGLHAQGETVVRESTASRDHTERMLKYLGAPLTVRGPEIKIRNGELIARPLWVPGDLSAAAFPIAAAAVLPGSELLIKDVGINPTRTGFLEALQEMGAAITIMNERMVNNEPLADLRVRAAELKNIEISGPLIPRMIDELPLLAVVATQAEGQMVIRDAGELRVKETDRIRAIVTNLRKMGARVEELPDGMVIRGPTPLRGAVIEGAGDHRIVMASAIAALFARGETLIRGAEWAAISFPGFFERLEEVRVDR